MKAGRLLGTTLALAGALAAVQVTALRGQDAPDRAQLSGGTLGVAAAGYHQDHENAFGFQPPGGGALLRCCLLRTLMSYNGRSAAEGGTRPRPDLAAAFPEISADGLTWTFRLKPGLRYAPPLADREIVAGDLVRALEALLRTKGGPGALGVLPFPYLSIEGVREFLEGEADQISGLETPDEHTLVVHLVQPDGDIAHVFAMPETAPLPPGDRRYGEGWARFLVASGPYMVEGAEQIAPSLPPEQQEPVSGYVPGESLTLVRNPSWDPATDELRGAYADRIEIELGYAEPGKELETFDEFLARLEAGELDLIYDSQTTFTTPETIERYQTDPELEDRLLVSGEDRASYLVMNLAVPPFDDVQVRKAVNLVFDKAAYLEWCCVTSAAAGHFMADSLAENLLAAYDPYETPGNRGDVEAARREMARSRYDADGDGLCDHRACTRVRFPVPPFVAERFFPDESRLYARPLAKLGIRLEFVRLSEGEAGQALFEPTTRFALRPGEWLRLLPSASDWIAAAFYAKSQPYTFGEALFTHIGASPEQLAEWGFSVTDLPSLDPKIEECIPLVGVLRTLCWAQTERILMEEIVPVIPLFDARSARYLGPRVAEASVDAAFAVFALDQVALKPGSE